VENTAKTMVKESHKFELACLKKRRRKRRRRKNILAINDFGHLATFWFGTLSMLFSTTGCVVHHENART